MVVLYTASTRPCVGSGRWLNRRSQRNNMTWERFLQLVKHYVLPQPRILHLYGTQRNLDLRSRMR
jgi:hypothetical protein